MKLCDFIKSERQKRLMNQREFGEFLDLTFVTICRIEKGKGKPSIKVLKKISEKLNVSPEKLIKMLGE